MGAAKKILIGVALVGSTFWLANIFAGGFLGALTGTTTDPRSMGLMSSDSMKPIRGRLKTNAGQTLTFEAPATYFGGIGRRAKVDGEQTISFKVWSKTFDPASPDRNAAYDLCNNGKPQGAPNRPGCPYYPPGSSSAARRDAGEWEVDIDMFNSNKTTEERSASDYRRYSKARTAAQKGRCDIGFDTVSGLRFYGVPLHLHPPVNFEPHDRPELCDTFIIDGIRTSNRQPDNSYVPYYSPPKIFFKTDADNLVLYWVDCNAVNDNPRLADRCTMSIMLSGWSGRAWVPYDRRAEWDRIQTDILAMLRRFTVKTTN